jgi:hypothetical protein
MRKAGPDIDASSDQKRAKEEESRIVAEGPSPVQAERLPRLDCIWATGTHN